MKRSIEKLASQQCRMLKHSCLTNGSYWEKTV